MAARKKFTYEGDPWPKHWVVSFEWDVPDDQKLPRGSVRHLETLKWEVALKGHPSVWYRFIRHVYNPAIDKYWVDALALDPHAYFTAFRPEEIINTRRYQPPRPKKIDTVKTNGKT